MSNKALWDRVFKTNPSKVKPITGKQYRGSSPNPYYLVERMTEVFGPCGLGWGFTIDERVEDAGPAGKLHIAKVKVWYALDGKHGVVEHVGGTPFCGTRKNGDFFLDEDAPKKSVTDALVKALSMLGFAGDIFSGRWDDCKYVEGLVEEFREEGEKKRLEASRHKAIDVLEAAALQGYDPFLAAWKKLSPAERELCKSELDRFKKEIGDAANPGAAAKP